MQSPVPASFEATFDAPFVATDLFNLLTAVDAYDAASTTLVATWRIDPEVYATVVERLEPVRLLGSTLPLLTVLSLQLVIAHTELVSVLWEKASSDVPLSRIQLAQERHALAIQALRAACEKLLTRQ